MSGHGWDYLKHIQGASGLGPRPTSSALADTLVYFSPVRSLIGSVSPFVRSQPIQRYHINRTSYAAKARARKAVIERKLTLVAGLVRASASFGGLGGAGALGGPLEGIEASLAAARQAEADALALSTGVTDLELDDFATQVAYKVWGETEGRLGLPLSLGSFNTNAAYQRLRSGAEEGTLPTNLGNWLALVPNPTAFAGEFLSNAELMVHGYVGGRLDQALGSFRTLRDGLMREGSNVLEMASGFAGSVEAGGLSIVQDAMELRPDWLSNDLIRAVGGSLRSVAAAASSADLTKVFTAIGGGIMTVGASTGPAAPFVMAAGGLMMVGSMLADIFGASDAPPPPGPFRVSGEQWGSFKLLYAAAVDGSAMTSMQSVATEQMVKVFGDPNTGETMVQPMPGRIVASAMWPHAMRMVDLLDRRALVNNDRVGEWVKTGRGIMFDSVEHSPANLWSKVRSQDPFVKFAGAMSSSPVPFPTGGNTTGDSSWPVGPCNRWVDGYWSTPHYRAAYVAAAALGGSPPFASYGYWSSHTLGGGIWASGGKMHCTGVGGWIDPGPAAGGVSRRWIPWCSYYEAGQEGVVLLVPPRKVPYHLQGLPNTDARFREWLFNGKLVASQIDRTRDPEIVVMEGAPTGAFSDRFSGAEAQRVGMVGNPLDRAMMLQDFFAARSGDVGWYTRPYDINEPRTWFIKETPAVVPSGASGISYRRHHDTVVRGHVRTGGGGGGGGETGIPAVAIVGGLGVAGLLLWLALS